jgi:2-C-methyl-D-erythritol 4-phosphate cytidylyltransferase
VNTEHPSAACIIVAAGRGERLGARQAKALVPLEGRPLLAWALDGVRADDLAEVGRWAPGCTVVAGGATRQQSVTAGLAALADDPVDYLLVHDAARCLTPPKVITAVLAALRQGHRVVIPAVPVVDTLRLRTGGVVDRSALVAVQTPQGFTREVLLAAHSDADPDATDDALLAERGGARVQLVPGHEESVKITTALDLLTAAAIVRSRRGVG